MGYIIKFFLALSVLLSKGIESAMDIRRYELENGLTVLVRENHTVPKVSIQVWYGVGSKDEQDGEKGRAHLIEHMIFKGTQMLSETDIKVLTHTLSGNCNAFTSFDFTGYLFNMPSQNWRAILPVMADCMSNVAFKEDHLSSEMKAVIQELKMNRDNHISTVVYDLLTAIFPDHPYHYPLIGYKQDLWSARAADLERFYKQHYFPNNATLVVVGDVDADEVFALAQEHFGSIPANKEYQRKQSYHNQDIAAKSVTLYRDVQQSVAVCAYVIPGLSARKNDCIKTLIIALTGGKNSRLYKKLVDGERLVTEVSAFDFELFEHSLFLVVAVPKRIEDLPTIERLISEELADIAANGLSPEEVQQALKKAKMNEYALLEKNESQAYAIGKNFLATGDPAYGFNYLATTPEELGQRIQAFVGRYLRASVMHRGLLLPITEQDKAYWSALQTESDALDTQVLSAHERITPVEPPCYALGIKPAPMGDFNFPKAQEAICNNGLKILSYDNKQTPKINILLAFKATNDYDPEEKQGLYNFVARMMPEGTKKHTAQALAHELESRGIMLYAYPGGVSMTLLKEDFETALAFLHEVLTEATFPEEGIEKVRAQLLIDLKFAQDNPQLIASKMMQKIIYAGHPYSKDGLGTAESVSAITREDLVDFYTSYISPDGATCVVVGDLPENAQATLQRLLGSWQGTKVSEQLYPALKATKAVEQHYFMNRDQVVLLMGRLSIERRDPDFDKLLIFDQILSGSLNSRLFKLREQSGLFYTISGSTIAGSNKEPGKFIIFTMVSVDRLQEAEDAIKKLLAEVVDTLTEEDIVAAKDTLANGLVSFFDANTNIASAFMVLDEYGFPADYFDHRAKELNKITLQEVKDAARKYINPADLNIVKVGRVA